MPRSKAYRAGCHYRAVNVLWVTTQDRRREQADASVPRSPGRQPSEGLTKSSATSSHNWAPLPTTTETSLNLPTVCECVQVCMCTCARMPAFGRVQLTHLKNYKITLRFQPHITGKFSFSHLRTPKLENSTEAGKMTFVPGECPLTS